MTAIDAVPIEFDRFFESSFPRMLARALMLSGNRHDAEDAVQEAYTEALRRWDRVGGYDAPDAWVYRVVQQRLWKATKRWRRTSSLEAMELDAWLPAAGGPEQAIYVRLVLAEVVNLPHQQRTVVVLHCVHGMEQQEIADLLRTTVNSVRQSLFKARRKLEKVLYLEYPRAFFRSDSTTNLIFIADEAHAVQDWLSDGIAANEPGRERLRRAILDRVARRRRS